MKRQEGFFDRFQPDYLLIQLFGLHEAELVKWDTEKFRKNIFVLMLFLIAMRFFMVEVMPSFLGMILIVIVCYILLVLVMAYVKMFNNLSKSSGAFGIFLSVLILIILVLVI